MRQVLIILGVTAALALTLVRSAEADDKPAFVVIVQSANKTTQVSHAEMKSMYLKKTTRWKDDVLVVPLDLPLDAPTRASFTSSVFGKSAQAVQSEWRQRIFTGQGTPPRELKDDATIIATVAATPGALGYVAADAKLPATVKVLAITE